MYGHLGHVRHRSDVVEFRAKQHAAILGDRLKAVCRNERQTEGVQAGGRIRKSLSVNKGG